MKPETRNGLVPNPEEQALQETVARLRASLTALLLQKDELLLIQCKRVESLYLRRFGALELKLYEAWCDCLRAKKKAKLIRVCRNRRQAVDVEQIEARLEEELSVYRQQLEQRSSRVFGALRSGEGSGLTSRGVKELKNLYRQAVKALHPDLHPGDQIVLSRRLMLESAGLFEIVVDNHTTTAKCGGFPESLGTNDGGEEGRKDIIPVEIMVMDVEVFLEFADKEGTGGIRLQLFKSRGGASKSLLHATQTVDGFLYTKSVGHLAEHDSPEEGVR